MIIRDPALVESFERSLIRGHAADYRRNIMIFEALYSEACMLGVLPLQDPLDGIDLDIRLAGVLNDRTAAPKGRGRT